MTSSVCAYCKKQESPTREHLWPTSLHSRLVAANGKNENAFWLARLKKFLVNEPVIKDVCEYCNNVTLSQLDAYICDLFDSTLVHMPNRGDIVTFKYDYHLLKRWLLKMSFNSARINKSHDHFALERMLPYIMGQDEKLGRYVQVFVQLSYPEEVPEQDIADGAKPVEPPLMFYPTIHRGGHMFFRLPGIGQKVLRTVHLRSFSFFLAFFAPGENRAVMEDFSNLYSLHHRSTRLKPSATSVNLVCDGIGAWTSLKGARENEMVFSD